ncbi:MAG: T9SS type A sorting domain-containing protein [Bacteroidetes bacterium]|nr:T9SS type A sorting domain-containing protein [Bacteroidota bacterium]
MKPIIVVIVLIVFCSITSSIFSQIAVNQSDMPVIGDTLRVSATNTVPAGYARAAMDTVWDFTALDALSQRVESYVSTSATPVIYQWIFVKLGGANLAAPSVSSDIPGLSVSQGFTFFKNSMTAYSDLGSAYTIQSLPLTAKYDNPDMLYQFPLIPGLSWSSNSSFNIDIPDLAYFGTKRIRSSLVDGWGTLTTPFGTFQTLRVKSILTIHDSVYLDSLGSGLSINRNVTEYKWLAKGMGIPVLQINEEGNVATAVYRDVYRMSAQPLSVTLGPDTAVLSGTVLTMHVSVAGGTPPYQILWSTGDTGKTITVTVQDIKTYSVWVVDAVQKFGTAQKVVSIKYPPGLSEHSSTQLQAYPNPTCGPVTFTLNETTKNAIIQVITPHGKILQIQQLFPDADDAIHADLSFLPDGIYLVRVLNRSRIYNVVIQVIH